MAALTYARQQVRRSTMGTALAGLAVLLTVGGLAWALWWLRARRPRLRAEPPDPTWASRPQPGEIWWADVPFQDGTGRKVRPCLVVRTHRAQVEVLKITSQDQRARRDHVEIPTRAWDRRATHNSFLDLSRPLRIRDAAFARKAGTVDAETWHAVRQLHSIGWVA
jgi:mRNA-degrading endonuclease toxin of MazEF toxin-antitoxin module